MGRPATAADVRRVFWILGGALVAGVLRRTRQTGGTARVEGVLQSGAGNVDLVAHFTDEAGGWKLTGLVLGGSPALPGP